MKIVDNKKDFYDFVAGEYGIDDLIVFDRRKSIVTIFCQIYCLTIFIVLFAAETI